MTRLEQAAHELLKAALRFQDAYRQGCAVTEDAIDLFSRAEDVILPIGTSMTTGTVIADKFRNELRVVS